MKIFGPYGEVQPGTIPMSQFVLKNPPNQNYRFVDGQGLQLFNPDTGLWHTVISQGAPAQVAQDDGTQE